MREVEEAVGTEAQLASNVIKGSRAAARLTSLRCNAAYGGGLRLRCCKAQRSARRWCSAAEWRKHNRENRSSPCALEYQLALMAMHDGFTYEPSLPCG